MNTPLHFRHRAAEKFNVGDKAWISWDGKKAISVWIKEVDPPWYSVNIAGPKGKNDNCHCLRLDEVRSTPELAKINMVTF